MIEEAGLDTTEKEELENLMEEYRGKKEGLKELKSEITELDKKISADHNIICSLKIQMQKMRSQIIQAKRMKKDPNYEEVDQEENTKLEEEIKKLELEEK